MHILYPRLNCADKVCSVHCHDQQMCHKLNCSVNVINKFPRSNFVDHTMVKQWHICDISLYQQMDTNFGDKVSEMAMAQLIENNATLPSPPVRKIWVKFQWRYPFYRG